jgi:lipase chaperone LimK
MPLAALAAVAAACGWLAQSSATLASRPSMHRTEVRVMGPTPAPASEEAITSVATPLALHGTQVPRLPIDSHGHLGRTVAVREFFDYFLLARNELPPPAVDARVKREIAAQMGNRPAALEARDVWRRYRDYLDAIRSPGQDRALPSGRVDVAALRRMLDTRRAIASRTLGEWTGIFFDTEDRLAREALARLAIASDPTLSEAEKGGRLHALDASASADEQAAQAAQQREADTRRRIEAIQSQHLSADQIRAQAGTVLNLDATERLVQQSQAQAAWDARYNAYALQRTQLVMQWQQANLSPGDYATRLAQLRDQAFSSTAERTRAASLDAGAPPTR